MKEGVNTFVGVDGTNQSDKKYYWSFSQCDAPRSYPDSPSGDTSGMETLDTRAK